MPLLAKRDGGAVILATGSEQKATLTFLDGGRAYVSQHLGDLEHLGAMHAWEEARERYERLFDAHPQVIACDMHPEYLASKWAREYAHEHGLPLIEVQHHHAHIASVLGENELHGPVIGIALDGTGYGTDGTIWGWRDSRRHARRVRAAFGIYRASRFPEALLPSSTPSAPHTHCSRHMASVTMRSSGSSPSTIRNSPPSSNISRTARCLTR